jgi:hypothetical protein
MKRFNARIFFISSLIFISTFLLLTSSKSVQASSCPDGASDCYMCGGQVPCTRNCTGVYNEITGKYMSCECPQGEDCTCYCPYIDIKCAVDPDCASDYIPGLADTAAYVSKVSGNPYIIKAVSGERIPLTDFTVINYGDTLDIGLDDSAFITFEGGYVRGLFGESYVTIEQMANRTYIYGGGKFWLVNLAERMYEELDASRNQPRAVTICGIGDYIKYHEIRYDYEEGCEMEYDLESEAVFDIEDSHLVNVLEGEVTGYDDYGEKVEIPAGKKFSIDTFTSVEDGELEDFDIEEVDYWWAEDFSDVTCDTSCSSSQTPFPGCSCLDSSSQDSDLLDSDTDEKLGGLYDPTIVCLLGGLCLCFVGVVVIVVIVLLIIKGRGKGKG